MKAKSELAKIIRERRSVKKGYNNKPVEKDLVLELLNDAVWAPTHGLREPWRFIFVGEEQKNDFVEKIVQTYPEYMQENRRNYLQEPSAFLIVIMDAPEKQKQWDENFGATASMIQNFQLLAWERGLGVVWKTNPHIYDPQVSKILKVGDNEKIVGFLHLGYFDNLPAPAQRTPAEEKFNVFNE